MAVPRLLGTAAACVIPLSFAAEDRKSYWSGCIQATTVICQQIFAILVLVSFLLKIIFKSASKSSFFCFGVEIRFWSCKFRRRCATADRSVMAASRLLGAAAACVILLSFAAEDRKSYWSGCIQAATVICQQIFAILVLVAAKRIVMASSRLLGTAAACVIPLSCAAEDRKSYWSGCIQATTVICQQIFAILVLVFFFVKRLF